MEEGDGGSQLRDICTAGLAEVFVFFVLFSIPGFLLPLLRASVFTHIDFMTVADVQIDNK